jgi:hypothetical protein
MSSAIAVFRMGGWRPSGISTEVIIGLFAREAEQIWSDWNLLIRNIIKRRGRFEAGPLRQWHAPSVKRCLCFARDVIGVAQLKRSMAPRPTRWLGQCQFCVHGAVSHELCIDLASMRRHGGDAKDSTSLRDTRPWTRAVCQNLERPPSESRFGSVEQHMRSFPPIHSC